jgi:hypothetical protein
MLIQRFGAAASLYIDLHCRLMDEPYGLDTEADGVQSGAGVLAALGGPGAEGAPSLP